MLIWSDGIALSVFYAGKEALAVLGKQSVRGFVNGQEIGFCGEDIAGVANGFHGVEEIERKRRLCADKIAALILAVTDREGFFGDGKRGVTV